VKSMCFKTCAEEDESWGSATVTLRNVNQGKKSCWAAFMMLLKPASLAIGANMMSEQPSSSLQG
jgi:hypothetical protein